MIDTLIISPKHMYSMQTHVNAEAPLEACGLIGGKNGIVELVLPVKNVAASRTIFSMEPRAQLRAMSLIEAEGLELLAIFHSHPRGASAPSITDIKQAAYPVVNIIWSKVGRRWLARGFWIDGGVVTEVPLVLR